MHEAFEKSSRHGLPRTMAEHLAAAATSSGGAPCRLAGLGRPRVHDLVTSAKAEAAGRPSIAVGPSGPVVVWTEAHESPEHAFAVLLDANLGDAGSPMDVTPDGVAVGRPELVRAGDRILLAYAETRGADAGVHARFLDGQGRGATDAVTVSATKPGNVAPSIAGAPDGSFWFAWSDDGDVDSEDLFLRHVGADLVARGRRPPRDGPVRRPPFPRARAGSPRSRSPAARSSTPTWIGEGARAPDPAHAPAARRRGQGARAAEAGRAQGSVDRRPRAGQHRPRQGGQPPDRLRRGRVLRRLARRGEHGHLGGLRRPGAGAAVLGASGGATAAGPRSPSRRAAARRSSGTRTSRCSPPRSRARAWGRPRASAAWSGIRRPRRSPRARGPGEWFVAWLDYESAHLEPYAARVVCK